MLIGKRKNAAAFYLAGMALARVELGLPQIAIVLTDAPRMEPEAAKRELAAFIESEPPQISHAEAELELLPLMTGAAATLRAGYRDEKLHNAVALQANKIAGALRMQTVEEAQNVVGEIGERAKGLLAWRWHAVERVAKALRSRSTLAGEDIAALLSA
jgi:hypothetical protein